MATSHGKSALKRRTEAKRSRKAAYKAMAGASAKQKLDRALTKFSAYKHRHQTSWCGNPGCAQCYPQLNKVYDDYRVDGAFLRV